MKNNVWVARLIHGSIGAVLGIAVAAFLGFGSGAITTHSRMNDAVMEARVSSYASVCADEAVVAWRGEKHDTAALRKIDAWDTREKLAKAHVGELPIAKDADLLDRVTRRCASDLMAAAAETPTSAPTAVR
jgi:hypothetical protein